MSTTALYTKGAKVWLPDVSEVWQTGEILHDYKEGSLVIQLENGEVKELEIKDLKELPPLRNPEFLIGGNDLTSLSYLHEPAVLHSLNVRFMNYNAIYTYCGIVLVAINPYQELPIYSHDTVLAYRNKNQHGSLDPHIFAVAEEAFTKMERENQDQSIIVSGESGAGKTVSAKYAMRYFATAGGSATETQVERKVLASSPIMEAIGNAKTTRNDNSSRFGKYIELGFNNQYHIQGAGMRTYLLEKSRVVFQSPEERNYHIFYQLCAAAQALPDLAYLELGDSDQFHYTRQGGCATIAGVDDLTDFQETRRALQLLGFGEEQQAETFRVLAALLHLGNVAIIDADHDGCHIVRSDPHLTAFCSLMGLQNASEEMRKWLCFRQIVSMREVFTKPMTAAEASFARDALAKHIYSLLFQRIVSLINKSLASAQRPPRFIGVLDIYGFETFDCNSFEQFCINYANEKLQQQFNQHVFKLEQEEYVREQIEWTFIDFYDNQPCIDLIERPLGVLDLLDEECRVPRGADHTWVEKLYDKCKKYAQFAKPRLSNSAFIIAHFADRVEYQCEGFVEKNRDTVLDEQVQILRNSTSRTVVRLVSGEPEPMVKSTRPGASSTLPSNRGGSGATSLTSSGKSATLSKTHRKTVGSQFRESLSLLMQTLNSTTPHYVRCIKPNDSKESFAFDPRRAVQQLRACGVIETVRISAAGFPSRLTYDEFRARYRVLFHSSQGRPPLASSRSIHSRMDRMNSASDFGADGLVQLKKACQSVLTGLITEEDRYKMGATKILFRAGIVAYLEKRRSDRLRACGILVQRMIRGWFYRRQYLKLRRAAICGQRLCRGYLARRRANLLRQTRAAITIQRRLRGFLQRRRYLAIRSTTLALQTYGRGALARSRYLDMVRRSKAIIIQKTVRGFLQRRRYERACAGILLLQCCWRRWLARRRFRTLRAEARSIEHVRNLNKGLENKIISLQQRIGDLTKELQQLRQLSVDYQDLRRDFEAQRGQAAELKAAYSHQAELQLLVEKLRQELQTQQDEKMDLVVEAERGRQELADTKSVLEELREQFEKQQKSLAEVSQETEETLKRRLDQERAILAQEYDQERAAYQKLLHEFREMEDLKEEMESQLEQLRDTLTPKIVGVSTSATSALKTEVAALGHSRNASNVSTLSNASHSESMMSHVDDDGYGSVRLSTSTLTPGPQAAVSSTTPQPTAMVTTAGIEWNIGLVLKLQQRLHVVEKDRTILENRMEELERESPTAEVRRAQDLIRLQELEMENAKLKDDLRGLRRTTATDPESSTDKIKTGHVDQLLAQFDAMSDELDRRREECIQLRTVLANSTLGQLNDPSLNQTLNSSMAASFFGCSSGSGVISDDNTEILMAFETQKRIIRHLENELQEEKASGQRSVQQLRVELLRARDECQQAQQLLALNLNQTPATAAEAVAHHEITRLTAENMELQERNGAHIELQRKYKQKVKFFVKRLKEAGLWNEGQPEVDALAISTATATVTTAPVASATTSAGTMGSETIHRSESQLPLLRKKDVDYLGMFEFNMGDEKQIVRHLIYDLKPRVASTLLPGLPAHVIFMCIRHADYINNDEKIKSFLTATINAIRRLIKKRHEDLDTSVLWLVNTCRLLHNLKQYSGEKAFQEENTAKQNEQCLRNFDLSEYRQVLSDIAVWIYQAVIKIMEERVQQLIVTAVLEHEAISGLSSHKPVGQGVRQRAGSTREPNTPVDPQEAITELLRELTIFHQTLQLFGVEPTLVAQAFRQVFYYVCACALNNLLLRREMCHWSKGIQIRYNISHLEQWVRDQHINVQDTSVNISDTLQPIIQAAQLLQARKSDDDVVNICRMCPLLTSAQIIKILNLYTPADELEDRIPISFIRRVQAELAKRPDPTAESKLLMDTKLAFTVRFPFSPSAIKLESIDIPSVLYLSFLKKV